MVLKSASARLNGRYRIKKTSESRGISACGDKVQLRDNYERLRAYILSPIKAPTQIIGLDLWLKRGFLAWIASALNRISPPEPIGGIVTRSESADVSADLVAALTNILIEWSE